MKLPLDRSVLDQRRVALEVEMRELGLRISVLENQLKTKRLEHRKIVSKLNKKEQK